MFVPVRFKTSIQLTPDELAEACESYTNDDVIRTKLMTKLRESLEGVCSRYGFIKPGSLDIVRRSAGLFAKQHFNGHIKFDIQCRADVCNPPQGLVVEGVVKNKNALGLLVTSGINMGKEVVPVLEIIVPRLSNGIVSEIKLENVNIGDKIFVMVMGKKYQLNDKTISIIGKAVLSLDSKLDDPAPGEGEGEAEGDGEAEGEAKHMVEVEDEGDAMGDADGEGEDGSDAENGDGDGDAKKEEDEEDEDKIEEDDDYDDDDQDGGGDDDIYSSDGGGGDDY